MSHWWRTDELRALLQAWEQSVPVPRDRDELQRHDLQRLFKSFNALRPRDGAPITIRQVEAQRQRLVRTFLFLRAFNIESARAGRLTWFQLSPPQQDDLRRLNGRLGALAAVTPDEFDLLARICTPPPPPPPPSSSPSPPPPPPLSPLPLPVPMPLEPSSGSGKEQGPKAKDRSTADEMTAAAEALAGLPMFRSNQLVPPVLSSLPSPAKPLRQKQHLQQQEVQLEQEDKPREIDPSGSDGSSSEEVDPGRSIKTRGRKQKESDMDYTPPKAKSKGKIKNTSKWSNSDETRLILAWHQVVTSLADNGYAGSYASRNEGLRLNSLIHQRYVELCGDGWSPARTNQSTGAKKYAIMMAFRSLRNVLRTLASMSERPNWFGMTPDERMELQKNHGHHHEHTCLIEKETYQQLAEIDRAQRTVLTPITNALRAPLTLDELLRPKKAGKKGTKKKNSRGPSTGNVMAEQSLDEDESSDDEDNASVRIGDRSEQSSRARPASTARRSRPTVARKNGRELDAVKLTSSVKRRRTGLSDAKWVTGLLNAQTQRFESLLAEFQEERRQERKHNLEIILEALKLRNALAQKPKQPSRFAETLVEKQRQHMLKLFNQLQDERSQERDQARMLLRELRPSRLVSQEQEQNKE